MKTVTPELTAEGENTLNWETVNSCENKTQLKQLMEVLRGAVLTTRSLKSEPLIQLCDDLNHWNEKCRMKQTAEGVIYFLSTSLVTVLHRCVFDLFR